MIYRIQHVILYTYTAAAVESRKIETTAGDAVIAAGLIPNCRYCNYILIKL